MDNQSTLDLICNKKLETKIEKSNRAMTVQGKGGTLDITHRAKLKGYTYKPWLSKEAITNILSFKNMIKQYRITYDSNDEMFVVHRKESGLPNMEFSHVLLDNTHVILKNAFEIPYWGS